MKEHTTSLLLECSQGCKMGIKSISQISDYISDQGLKRIVDKYLEEHRHLEREADHLLVQYGQEVKPPEMMATAMSWISTEMKMMMKGDDKQAAKILTEGCDMGIRTICGFQNQYSGAAQAGKNIADKLVKIEENFREELKAYL